LKEKVLALRRSMPRLGTRKLHFLLREELQGEGLSIGRDRFFDLLRDKGLLVKRKRRFCKTTDSRGWMRRYPDRVKNLEVVRPEQVWVADITYVALRKGFCYLHLVTDAYSKQIMGYVLSEDLQARHSLRALQGALKQRCYTASELIHHSDRGLQYCSALYTGVLEQHRIHISTTQDGSPYDNAVAERINGILKDEYGLDEVLESFSQAKRQVKEAVKSYNNQRPHLSNHYLTPKQMHQQSILKPRKWNKKTTRIATDPGGA
jgi:transposase InsO family protein